MKENTRFRSSMVKFSKKTSEELERVRQLRRYNQKMRYLNACSSYDHQKIWKQARKCGTSNRIYEHEQYKEWFRAEQSTLLWCSGILGAGKTVIAANVVEHLSMQAPAATVAYFFCRFDQPESLESWTVIGSLVRQLLLLLEPEAFNDLSQSLKQGVDEDKLSRDLQRLLQHQKRKTFIVLDGLDDCDPRALKCIGRFLKDLLEGEFQFQIFCSSRLGFHRELAPILRPKYHILCSELATETVQYINDALAERVETGELCLEDPGLILRIREALVKGS